VPRDTSFSYSFLALPARQRQAIGLVWDFFRAVDDAVDEATDAAAAAADLAAWRGEVARVFGCDAPATPQGTRLKPLVAEFGLSRQPFDDLVDGVEMDLGKRRYETFAELESYCLRVASAVGMTCIEIFGSRTPGSRDYARSLGVALQLTNIIRDVATDLARGRVYLPQEDLARFGVGDADLAAGRVTGPVRALLAFECARARQFFAAAARAMPAGEAWRLVGAEIMGGIYFEILRRIEARGYDVFSEVIRVPKIVRARIALTTWARTAIRGRDRDKAQ
jgi:phytoene synthase